MEKTALRVKVWCPSDDQDGSPSQGVMSIWWPRRLSKSRCDVNLMIQRRQKTTHHGLTSTHKIKTIFTPPSIENYLAFRPLSICTRPRHLSCIGYFRLHVHVLTFIFGRNARKEANLEIKDKHDWHLFSP